MYIECLRKAHISRHDDRSPLRPLDTILPWCSRGFSGALILSHVMPSDISLFYYRQIWTVKPLYKLLKAYIIYRVLIYNIYIYKFYYIKLLSSLYYINVHLQRDRCRTWRRDAVLGDIITVTSWLWHHRLWRNNLDIDCDVTTLTS